MNQDVEMEEISSFEQLITQKSGSGDGPMGHTECKTYLRHSHPMLGLDRIIDHSFNEGWVHAVRAISCSQPVFEGHFEDAAIYPGTNLVQDIIQVGILLFVGTTGALKGEGENQDMTAVSSINTDMGHPVPPGSLLDIGVWRTAHKGKRSMTFNFMARMRDFAYYENPNRYGMTFRAAIEGEATLVRIKRKIYTGIGF